MGGSRDGGEGNDLPRTVRYDRKDAARQALPGPAGAAANRFFRDATSLSRDFTVSEESARFHLAFFTPARNPGYGKHYHQVIDKDGRVLREYREYKETWGPEDLVEVKWLHGAPDDE